MTLPLYMRREELRAARDTWGPSIELDIGCAVVPCRTIDGRPVIVDHFPWAGVVSVLEQRGGQLLDWNIDIRDGWYVAVPPSRLTGIPQLQDSSVLGLLREIWTLEHAAQQPPEEEG